MEAFKMAEKNTTPKDYDRWGKTAIKVTGKPKKKTVKKGK